MTNRKPLGLNGSQSTTGIMGSQPGQPEISLIDLSQISQAVQFRAGEDNLKTLAMDEDALSKLPMAVQPEAVKSQLLPYQLQGLAWLQSKEDPKFPLPGSDEATQLWKRDASGRYVNAASSFTVASAPKLAKGGILADDMGLGKTLQMISLILTGGRGTTLIVYVLQISNFLDDLPCYGSLNLLADNFRSAPKSVMSNWAQQALQHVHEDKVPRV